MTAFIHRRALLAAGAGALAAPALGIGGLARAHDDPRPLGAWTPLAPLPFPVQEIYPAPFWKDPGAPSLKPKPFNIIVNAGGLTPETQFNVTDAVTHYDPATNEWGYGAPLPAPRHHIALVNNNGILYGAGGFARDAAGGWKMRADVWRTRSLAGPWEAVAPLPHPQAETVCASLGGFIHVAGGRAPSGSRNIEWSDHIDTDEHWVYDAAANRWRALAPMPTARNSAAGVSLNGVLYVIGGRRVTGGNLDAVEVYDPLADRWGSLRPLPKAQAGLAAAAIRGKIYVFGGEYFEAGGGGGVFAEAWEYDPRTDDWRAAAAMPTPRHGLGAVALDNAIYVIGGAAQAGGDETTALLDRFEI